MLGKHDRVDGQVCRPRARRAREGAARAVKMGIIQSEIYTSDLETLKMKAVAEFVRRAGKEGGRRP